MSTGVCATVILVVSLTGCHATHQAAGDGDTRRAPLAQVKGNEMIDAKANRQIVREQWDAFNRGDMAVTAEFWAEDTRNHGRPVGRVGVLAVLKDIQTTFPDVRFTALEFVTEGEWVSVRGMFSGTHRGVGRLPINGGMLVGVQPTGRHFEVQHIHMMQVRGGKIVEHFANRNDLGMMQQLGLLPEPAPPAH